MENPIDVNLSETQIIEAYTEVNEKLISSRALNYLLIVVIAGLITIITLLVSRGDHFTSNYEPYTDGWCIEYTHYMHPNWTAQQCEDFVFMSSEKFAEKYNLN